MHTLEETIAKIKQKMAFAPPIGAKIKFDFGDQGAVFVDAVQTPPVLSQDEKGEADLTLSCSLDTFSAILTGTQDPNIAFMTGKLKIKGSMGLALKLNAILED